MKKFIPFVLFTVSMISLGSTSTDYLKKDQLFTTARKLLIKDKWVPERMHTEHNYDYIGEEKDLIALKILELSSCSIDSSRCIFYYKKNDQCKRLDTIGEQVQLMKVVQWSDECPETPPSQKTIGTVFMDKDGSLILNLIAGDGGSKGETQFIYKKVDPDYEKILKHIGQINVGQTKYVLPWVDQNSK
ncbi:hypothetical protein AAKU58_000803 [Oxalobacteraceae bacterium GrIS 1.18]